MKKSLSLLLAGSMVFSAFAGVASAAEELDAQAKFEALKEAQIMFGDQNGNANLEDNMTRAQAAIVVSTLFDLDISSPPATATFTDLPSTHWAYEEVEAAVAAEIISGMGDGTFAPSKDYTFQELATMIAIGAGLELDEEAEVEGTVADWAKKYVAAAVASGLLPAQSDYTAFAKRSTLVEAAYATAVVDGKIEAPAPAKVSVASAKASGVSKIEVQLDKAVDTDKAKFEVKFGTAAVTLDKTEWSEDKKTATLTLKDQKIKEGEYTVTLTGLAETEVETASAKFTGEKETVQSIEFVTASDEIAKSAKAKIKVKAENQYGEIASFNISSYTVNAGDLTPSKKIDDEGYLIITLDTSAKNTGLDVVPVYVYFNDTRVMANKTFKVGATPFVSKMELGEVSYNNDAKALVKSGNVATIPAKLYDQYGNPVTPEQATADTLNINWSSYVTPFSDALNTTYDDSDDAYKVKVNVTKKIEKSGEYTITVFAGASTATAKLVAKTEKVAKDVTIGDPSKTIAAGDSSAIIPLYVTDEDGNALTGQEIVDNRSRISVTGGTLILYGKDKGKVRVTSIPTTKNSYFSLSVMINSTVGEAPGYDNKNFQVAETRVPSSLVVATPPKAKSVLGANSDFKVIVKDQYAEELDSGYALTDTYTVTATVTGAVYATALGKDANAGNDLTSDVTPLVFTYNASDDNFTQLNDGFTFDAHATNIGKSTVRFVLKKGADEIASKSVSIETIPTNSSLTYSLDAVGELYAALDNKDTYLDTVTDSDTDGNVDQLYAGESKLAKTAKIVVKDSSGNEVAFPDSVVDVVSSNTAVAVAVADGGKGYVIGNKAGTASVTVYVDAADGTRKALTSSVTVKADLVEVQTLSAKEELDINAAATIADVHDEIDLKAKDQYGIEITDAAIRDYDKLLGIRFTVSDITATGPANTVSVNAATGVVTVGADVQEFTLTAVSRNGEVTATTLVTR